MSIDHRPPLEPGSASRRLARPLSPAGPDYLAGRGCVAEPWSPDIAVGVLGLEPHPLAGDINDAIGAVPGIERGTATLLVPRKWRTKPRTEANAGGEFA